MTDRRDTASHAPGAVPFAVLADDLTSAAEAAGRLADSGRAASVVLDADAPPPRGGGAWPCLDLDTRALAPGAAAALHARAARRLAAAAGGGRLGVYKTMDSSLRGNWPAELAAVLRACDRRVAVVAPAYPAYGRHTVGGRQYAEGLPVHEGPAGRDPVRPVRDPSVVALLAGAGLAASGVAPGALPDALAAALGPRAAAGPPRALVVDAASDGDLAEAARAVRGVLDRIVVCGSPGLWEALVPAPPGAYAALEPGRALVLVGSLHPATRRQVDRLRAHGVPVVVTEAADAAGERGGTAQAVRRLLSAHDTVALVTPERTAPAPGEPDGERHLRALAEAGAACARALPDLGLVLCGGDTARAVALALGAPALRVAGSIAPGIALGTLEGPCARRVISKAGGFGDPSSLVAAAAALTGRTP
ncbi:four-carbon acid sugar kinase family protein [Streptomyces sp. NPDC047002]|uniref:four-carbon acid sugar kinase family protein n=1 Tax=Streptomyces sp. NPDC047002 TaxID=3155475 RepID=UPI00345142A9